MSGALALERTLVTIIDLTAEMMHRHMQPQQKKNQFRSVRAYEKGLDVGHAMMTRSGSSRR